jgi:glycosyltransferase involved in cell wall biosynthesis
VLPSLVARDGDRDGLPNVLLEAAACGLPLVATQVGGISDFLDAATGQVCAPNDPVALASAIESSFADAAQTQLRCQAARLRVEEHFDIASNINRLDHAFRGEAFAL